MNTDIYLEIKKKINEADAIVIGAGSGLSTAAGINYGTKDFAENFPELVKYYGFTDMYSSSFYEFKTEEERWSYWAKHIDYLCLSKPASETYKKLYRLVKDKNYFVITTNVDKEFIKSGFNSDKVFEIQGTLTKIQCAKACHNKLYDDEELIRKMLKENNEIRVPEYLVPICPVCGGPMEVNLRKDEYFVEDDVWHKKEQAYEEFIEQNKEKKILFLELGAGFNTPGIIRFPFERLTYQLDNAFLIRINDKYAFVPTEIKEKSMSIEADINEVLKKISDK